VGAVLDASLLASGMWVLSPGVVASRLYDIDTIPRFRHADAPNPLVAVYTTRDDRQIYLSGIQTERHFENFCQVVERPDLLADSRFATGKARLEHAAECVAVIDEIFAARTLDEWRVTLAGLTTPWMVVQTAAEASRDSQVVANGLLVDVEGTTGTFPLVASPVQVDGVPPSLTRAPDHGEQTEAVLLELGRTWDEIAALKASGAVL
jgi:crotonobetainyl-CoA:carnitine CoA-transferase CaiB-like acyl-CoA transferase